LNDRNSDIAKKKAEIRSILNKKNATAKELATAKTLINDLNGKITDLEKQVTDLTTANTQLTADETQLTQDKEKLTTDLQTTTATNQDLSKKVDIASTLNASNITITPVHSKSNGQEKMTTNAKKVDKLVISFDVDNRIATTGQTDVYVCITAPDGKPVAVPALGSGTFTTRDEGDKPFTSKVGVDFEAGKKKSVQFAWKQDTPFQRGIYTIQIYHNGFKIGEGTKELKKGGIFG
jgi:hypothetical protein